MWYLSGFRHLLPLRAVTILPHSFEETRAARSAVWRCASMGLTMNRNICEESKQLKAMASVSDLQVSFG
jgi:hypothetical protein